MAIQVEKDFFEATKVSVSSRWRIVNLVKNAKVTNTYRRGDSIEFEWMLNPNENKMLVYKVNLKFFTDSQLSYINSLLNR